MKIKDALTNILDLPIDAIGIPILFILILLIGFIISRQFGDWYSNLFNKIESPWKRVLINYWTWVIILPIVLLIIILFYTIELRVLIFSIVSTIVFVLFVVFLYKFFSKYFVVGIIILFLILAYFFYAISNI